MAQLIGNRIMLAALSTDLQLSAAGVFVPNHYKRHTQWFEVLAVGPGTWVRKKGKPDRFIRPEVKLHDKIISRHWLDEPKPGWHKTEHVHREDQSSWVVIDARFVVAVMEALP